MFSVRRQRRNFLADWRFHNQTVFFPARFSLRGVLFDSRPFGRVAQAVVAELLSEALGSGMKFVDALRATVEAIPGTRHHKKLCSARDEVELGWEIAEVFRWVGIPLLKEVTDAFAMADREGDLARRLALVARQLEPAVAHRAAALVGRSPSVPCFASVMVKVLERQPLTFGAFFDAIELASLRDATLRRISRTLQSDLETGLLADTLAQHPRVFDRMFVRCVAQSQGRQSLHRTMQRFSAEYALE